jgi:hypothetical protein
MYCEDYKRKEYKKALLETSGGLASKKTLRDYFAGQALAGMCANEGDIKWIKERGCAEAYKMADLMLDCGFLRLDDEE